MLVPVYQVNVAPILKAIELVQRAATERAVPRLIRNAGLGIALKAYALTDPLRAGWPEQRLQVEVTSYTNQSRTREATSKKAPFIQSDRPLARGGHRISPTPDASAGDRPFPRTTRYTKVRPNLFGALTTTSSGHQVPLAVLVVMARMRPDSNYSRITDNRWPLQLSRLPKGKGSARARQAMIAAYITRMVRSRNSSRNLIRKAWSECANRVKRLFPQLPPDGGSVIDIQATVIGPNTSWEPISRASAGGSGSSKLWLTMENTVGETEAGPNLRARRQSTLMAHGGPALDAAIMAHVSEMRSHYMPKAAAELRAAWDKL